MYHQGNNVILMFKSVEIYLIDSDSEKPKINTPIYIPVKLLKDVIHLPKSLFETTIMGNIHFDQSSG